MDAELQDIQNFLYQYPPFNELPEETLKQVTKQIEISYYRKNSSIFYAGDYIHDLYVIRSGVVEIYRRNKELYNRLDEGGIFGHQAVMTNNKVRFSAEAIEDTLLYCIPQKIFQQLYDQYDIFADFVEAEYNARLHQTVTSNHDANNLATSKVTTLIHRDPVCIDTTETIQVAAQKMAKEGVSALLVMNPERERIDEENHPIAGIITERDLCSKVLAAGLSPLEEVTKVMTSEVIYLDHNAYVYEAMLMMLRTNAHHLPILKKNQPIGFVVLADIVRYESQNSLLLVNSIFVQNSVEELQILSLQVRDSFVRLVNEDANSHMVGSAMSVIGKSFKQRIIELAEEKLGEPPIPYCFLALGSMARDEQLLVTDQDNAIILDNSYNEQKHGQYFADLSKFVCDALDKCGYAYCTGYIMASTPGWRMTRNQWRDCFANWIDNPNPESLLNCSIFFDLTGVYGRLKWAEQLNNFIVRKARRNTPFLTCLARNALNRKPPLGFFQSFVMEKDGQHKNSINLKRRGTAPLADLIRVHALSIGSRSQNSFERLDDIAEAGILPKGRAQDLRDAMEFISMVRTRHQAIDVENGIEPDNNIEPDNLSDFERRNLKDAFQILSHAQNSLKLRYHVNNRF